MKVLYGTDPGTYSFPLLPSMQWAPIPGTGSASDAAAAGTEETGAFAVAFLLAWAPMIVCVVQVADHKIDSGLPERIGKRKSRCSCVF